MTSERRITCTNRLVSFGKRIDMIISADIDSSVRANMVQSTQYKRAMIGKPFILMSNDVTWILKSIKPSRWIFHARNVLHKNEVI